MAPGWTDNTLWGACRARRIKDVRWVIAFDRNTVSRCHALLHGVPIKIASLDQIGGALFALKNEYRFWFVAGQFNRAVDQGFVFNHAVWFQTTRCRQDHFRLGIINAHRQFVRRKATEDDRMHRTNARTRQHRDQRFWHHWHIDNYAIAFGDAFGGHRTGQGCNFVF